MRANTFFPVAFAILLVTLTSCRNSRPAESIPKAPDYSEAMQWYVTARGGVADIFYVTSTETGDYTLQDGTPCHYADVYAEERRTPLLAEMEGVDALVGGNLNFYAPYYRQCSIESFLDDSLSIERLKLPTEDMRDAFSHYIADKNPDRPFILAGFSQGAMIALELLREMDDEAFSRMVAAYIIGANITRDDLEASPRIIPAQRADDTGVTICYNSVRDASCAFWSGSAVAINPVNWCTDATPATLITVPSPNFPVEEQQEDTLNVHVDEASKLVFVDGFRGTDYVTPVVGREGNYHSREIWFYRDRLRENMALRVESFLNR